MGQQDQAELLNNHNTVRMWENMLTPYSKVDGYLRVGVAATLFFWLWFVGFHMETPYPPALIEAYALPLTRILLLLLVLTSAIWCPTVGILAALSYVCLGADVIFFTHGGKEKNPEQNR